MFGVTGFVSSLPSASLFLDFSFSFSTAPKAMALLLDSLSRRFLDRLASLHSLVVTAATTAAEEALGPSSCPSSSMPSLLHLSEEQQRQLIRDDKIISRMLFDREFPENLQRGETRVQYMRLVASVHALLVKRVLAGLVELDAEIEKWTNLSRRNVYRRLFEGEHLCVCFYFIFKKRAESRRGESRVLRGQALSELERWTDYKKRVESPLLLFEHNLVFSFLSCLQQSGETVTQPFK